MSIGHVFQDTPYYVLGIQRIHIIGINIDVSLNFSQEWVSSTLKYYTNREVWIVVFLF